MRRLASFVSSACLAALVAAAWCGDAAGQSKARRLNLFTDRGAEPNVQWTCNRMPDGNSVTPGFSNAIARSGTSLVMEFRFAAPHFWGGIVASASCGLAGWGKAPGPGFDLSPYKKLVVHARGEQGGEQVELKVGVCNTERYGDSVELPLLVMDQQSNTPTPVVTLSNDWRRFEIPLKGDVSRMICLLAVTSNRDLNRGAASIKVYLDDVYFE